ncbi:CoA transferase [Aquihabitans sp. McL0605]|uniref:CoA transferase n=1 Tax=Aquihabitans sp. McL0605 TaxID=3415671 RepID=UPI003CE7BB84
MTGPCDGLAVVEVAVGVSDLGLGLAGGLPGRMLADLGATVTRVVGTEPIEIDRGVTWTRSWHRDKQVVATDDPVQIAALLATADVALVYGDEPVVEQRGLGYGDVSRTNPALVYARCRPSRTGAGAVDDFGLLVEARAGFCTQLAGHRPGPTFVDVRAPGSGAAFLLTTSVLALLNRRAATGEGGWADTSLYDGMLATLGCMIGRPERAKPDVESYWQHGSTFPNFLYRCADGELIQVWFGGKGMYVALLDVLGDEPSPNGYYDDQITGALNDRALRWRSLFATQTRDVWIERLRAAGVACEPVLHPGEVLSDPHVTEIGLSVPLVHDGHDDLVAGSPIAVAPLVDHPVEAVDGKPADPSEGPVAVAGTAGGPAPVASGDRLLEGLRVVDFSAFVAGPLGAQVLADLGADVIKVEPPAGEAMRAAAYAVAACQRGKRGLALDIGDPAARPVVERLLDWADVVLHNFRVGVSTRLGIDEAVVGERNPGAVYCHASGFGTGGPRATSPGNDALMQALTGFEVAVGGAGNDPIAGTWIPIDMTGGWVAAIGILAGLYAKATTGRGQQVATSLLGAGMALQSGVFQRDGEVIPGPELDGGQTGYGPGYRIYEAADGEWFALVVPDAAAWERLRGVVVDAVLPATYAPLRGGTDDALARDAELALEVGFKAASAAEWVTRLRAADVLVEPIEPMDRDQFRRGILDDPVNRLLGRVASYATADWGWFEQIGPLLRCGPSAGGGPAGRIPRVGEDTVGVLEELGFDAGAIEVLLGADVARQLRT